MRVEARHLLPGNLHLEIQMYGVVAMTGFSASYYESLQGRIRGVLILIGNQLPLDDIEFLTELVDANELGVAVEMIAQMLTTSDLTVERPTAKELLGLATEMGLPSSSIKLIRGLRATSDKEDPNGHKDLTGSSEGT